MTAANDLLSSEELIAGTSITYRQLDYWCRQGVFEPAHWQFNEGSGGRRRWDRADRARMLALDAHLSNLRAQHLEPNVKHLRLWWSQLLEGT